MQTYLRVVLTLPMVVSSLAAQPSSRPLSCAGGAVPLRLPGGLGTENQRALGLRAGDTWSMMRGSTDEARRRMRDDTTERPLGIAAVAPEILVTSQSDFPMPANDGAMWAGRGTSASVSAGLALCGRKGRWGMIIAPTVWYAENADFDLPTDGRIVPPRRGEYSVWASPYFVAPRSLDAPRRFGDSSLTRIESGNLSAWVRTSRVEIGFTSESEWWGPGLHNALLLSSQAGGTPRAYVRTAEPIRFGGEIEAKWFLGRLAYSPFFRDPAPADSSRSLGGVALVWRPWFEPSLSLGMARLVASPMRDNAWFRRILSPFEDAGTPNARDRRDLTPAIGKDQLFSAFANWRLPDDGTEIWFEWGRAEIPTSLRDFLGSPNHSQALTLGLQHVRLVGTGAWTWRVAAEHSQTNQSPTYRERFTGTWYSSRAVPGGFSQRGQVLGAMIGPGSVTQRLSLDFASPKASAGLFAFRIKWDDDSFYTIPRPNGNGLCKHDVSLAYGGRGSAVTRVGAIEATITSQNRLNIWWQALGLCFLNEELQVDQRNVSLEFRLYPRIR